MFPSFEQCGLSLPFAPSARLEGGRDDDDDADDGRKKRSPGKRHSSDITGV